MKAVLLIGNGYIGSALEPTLKERYDRVTTVDIASGADIQKNYKDLTPAEVVYYNTVILLAGHSSVPMCENDRWYNTYVNNVKHFGEFIEMIPPDIKFIYASSASVYNQKMWASEGASLYPPLNPYDASKIMIDTLAKISKKNYYAMRFGTVCGRSPKQRMDLIYQRMAWNAVHKGCVDVYNADAYRSVLWMNDLKQGICKIIEGDDNPGVYNLCSYSATIANIGKEVGEYFDVPVNIHTKGKGTYTFTMDSSKIVRTYGYESEAFTEGDVILDDFPREYLESIKEEDFEKYTREIPYPV